MLTASSSGSSASFPFRTPPSSSSSRSFLSSSDWSRSSSFLPCAVCSTACRHTERGRHRDRRGAGGRRPRPGTFRHPGRGAATARAVLEAATREVDGLIDDARARGQVEHDRLVVEAAARIDDEHRRVHDLVMGQAVELVVTAAERIVGSGLGPDRHRATIASELAAADAAPRRVTPMVFATTDFGLSFILEWVALVVIVVIVVRNFPVPQLRRMMNARMEAIHAQLVAGEKGAPRCRADRRRAFRRSRAGADGGDVYRLPGGAQRRTFAGQRPGTGGRGVHARRDAGADRDRARPRPGAHRGDQRGGRARCRRGGEGRRRRARRTGPPPSHRRGDRGRRDRAGELCCASSSAATWQRSSSRRARRAGSIRWPAISRSSPRPDGV